MATPAKNPNGATLLTNRQPFADTIWKNWINSHFKHKHMSSKIINNKSFCIIADQRVPIEALNNTRLGRLLSYWNKKKKKSPLPMKSCIDPIELREHLTRLHILDVCGPGLFRYQLYGTKVTNPDLADMTDKLTTEYKDTSFGELVTRHLAECVANAAPTCREIIAVKNSLPSAYIRLALPWSTDGVAVSKLMVTPQRIVIPKELDRTENKTEFAR